MDIETGKMVPGGGFEPPTRGFSVRCSRTILFRPIRGLRFLRICCVTPPSHRGWLMASIRKLKVSIHANLAFILCRTYGLLHRLGQAKYRRDHLVHDQQKQ